MSSYREQGLKAKAARLGIVDQRGAPGKSKKSRPVIVEHRYAPGHRFSGKDRVWSKSGSYRTTAEAEMAMAALTRKYYFYEYRIKP